jgi:hypothetical protein
VAPVLFFCFSFFFLLFRPLAGVSFAFGVIGIAYNVEVWGSAPPQPSILSTRGFWVGAGETGVALPFAFMRSINNARNGSPATVCCV